MYVGRLHEDVTKEEILDLFSEFGKIVYFQKEKDYCFVEYDNI